MSGRALPLALIVAGACSTAGVADGSDPTELPLFRLSEPTLEIGAVDGAEEYLFGFVESVIRLTDGSIAVSDPGTTRISVYDAGGAFSRSWGSRGEGPGEFRSLSRIYPYGSDSILVVDQSTLVVSVFDYQGSLGRQRRATELSGDSVFSFDSWLYGRFWIDGALEEEQRAGVRLALEGLPPPRTSPGYRVVRVARDGDLWIREPGMGEDGLRTWTRADPSGKPLSVVQMPGAFHPLDIRSDEVLGRWVGENDVSFVRGYRLEATGLTRPVPEWLLGGVSAVAEGAVPDEEELLSLMRDAIRSMASAQEIHYSSNMTYTTLVDSLTWERPEGIEIDFVFANSRGWAGVFTHPTFDRVCGLAYGFGIPPGWVPGMVVCAPEATSATVVEGG